MAGHGGCLRACLKIHSRRLHAPLRGIFGPDSVSVARYASIIGTKSPTKWDAQPTESNFQTRSSQGMHVNRSVLIPAVPAVTDAGGWN